MYSADHYTLNSEIENAQKFYLFYKEHDLKLLQQFILEQLKALEKTKSELSRRTFQYSYIGPVAETRSILRSNAYEILELVRTRSCSQNYF